MKCDACGADIAAESRFCVACGTEVGQVERVCRVCSRPVRASARFCGGCGTPTAAAEAVAADDVPALAPALLARLDAAAGRCIAAIDAFVAGEVDEVELQRRLFEDGAVRGDGELWLLDVEQGRWCRYDGIRVWSAAGDAAAPTGEGQR